MENKKTAVDFLLHEISEIVGIIEPDAFSSALMKIKYEQAKAMEKEQIIEAWMEGNTTFIFNGTATDYYNETYGTPQ